jgi:CRISPR-associated protein Csd1
VCHIVQQAHIEVTIDINGGFSRARVLTREEQATAIPATEDSASRSSNDAPHALCDKLQYCAKDYAARGGHKKSYFDTYIAQLGAWCQSPFGHAKANAVYRYVQKGTLASDLIRSNVLVPDLHGNLLERVENGDPLPPLFKLQTAKLRLRDQGDALVRWRVEQPGELESAVWQDKSLQESWIEFCTHHDVERGICLVNGHADVPLALKHPRGIRFSGDGAKLISSNDKTNYTFRGRFTTGEEA